VNADYPHLTDLIVDDTWLVSEGRLDGKPMLVRIRQNLRDLAGHPQFPNRLRIVWEYEPENEAGLPSSEELESIQGCEDLLVRALEQDNHAILTHVVMCDGLRQWIFYCSDLEEAARRINVSLPYDDLYPIELSADPDASWAEYLETLGTIMASGVPLRVGSHLLERGSR
jgi:hypothetical protein